MSKEQLELIAGARIEPPECYDEVVAAMETVFSNQPEMEDWDIVRLASDIWQFAMFDVQPEPEDVEKSVRIYRERRNA
ncbi:hypothetical protein [uncultured Pelagimonas sp.]|uniref:hypothetical protein n=1 Tax=uncultured Pelagimonas sp. TaxID=1618102 RepID=UPI00261798CA|nr:hypothetical protein [uncultured Pelagimonas sp.]